MSSVVTDEFRAGLRVGARVASTLTIRPHPVIILEKRGCYHGRQYWLVEEVPEPEFFIEGGDTYLIASDALVPDPSLQPRPARRRRRRRSSRSRSASA